MRESVAVAKEADRKQEFSPTNTVIHHVRDEHEMQLGSLGGVIGNIRRDGGKPSVERIATELASRSAAERAPALIALQQTHGNRYVQRVVSGIQTKLVVGQPGDMYEQEADRVADEVMRMPEPEVSNVIRPRNIQRIQRECIGCEEDELRRLLEEEKKEKLIQNKPIAEQITSFIQRQVEEEEEEEDFLQTKAHSSQVTEVTSNIESRIQSLKGGGQPLSKSERAFFEPCFGNDFSQVRVHTDSNAIQMSRELNAQAFTHGSDIYFETGRYNPGTSSGKKLLAHELTHVVQQKGGGRASARGLRVPGANAIPWHQTRGSLRLTGHRVSVSSSIASTVIQRWTCEDNYTRMINAALVEARTWRVSALRWLRGHEDSLRALQMRQRRSVRSITDRGHLERGQLLNRHFGIGSGSSIDTVRTIGRHFHDVDLNELTFQCRVVCPQVRGVGAAADAHAGSHHFTVYTNCYSHDMHVSCNALLVLHEAFHASFSDFNHDTYVCTDEDYPGSRPLTNADSYASFAQSISGGLCGGCFSNI